MDDMNHRKMNDSLFDGSLLEELNGRKPDKISESSEDTSDKELSDKSDTEKANSVKPGEEEQPVISGDDTERSNRKLFIVRVLAVAVGVLGVIMLVWGARLSAVHSTYHPRADFPLDEASDGATPEK